MNRSAPCATALALLVLATAGCQRNDNKADDTAAAVPGPATTAAPPATQAMPAPAATAMNGSSAAMPDAAQSPDQRFVGEAMRANEEEIAITALAMDKGGTTLKPLADMLHKDHLAMRDKLNEVAHGTPAPTPASAPADLSTLVGKEFDRRVLGLLRDAHASTVAQFTAASHDAALAADVRALATESLPVLQGHLDKVTAALAKE